MVGDNAGMAPTGKGRARATYADLAAVPESRVAEIVAGHLHVSPRPAPRHARSASALGFRLGPAFDDGRGGPGGWWILFEPELHLADDVVVPDLAGWRRERLPRLPEEAHFVLAPDWLCEVVSPATEELDRTKKMAVYARSGVAHAWLVDPQVRTLESYRLDDGRWTLLATHAGDATARIEPFAAVALDLAALWA
jgi:Uma2 family endonuclease